MKYLFGLLLLVLAMAAPAALPEFKGNVFVVRTANYWDPQLEELDSRWGKVKRKRRDLFPAVFFCTK